MGKLKHTWGSVKELDAIRSVATILLSLVVAGVHLMLSLLEVPIWGIVLGGTIACSVLVYSLASITLHVYNRRLAERDEEQRRQDEEQRRRTAEGLLGLIDYLRKSKADDQLVNHLVGRVEKIERVVSPNGSPFTEWLR